LTNPNASVPANGPGRLTAIGSARARYWNEALEVFEADPLLGAGAEGYATARLRYRTAPLKVQQAHGFVVQTLADLGLVGLLLVLALFLTWLVAAGRATHPFNRCWSAWRWRRWPLSDPSGRDGAPGAYTAERIELLTMLCLVATFGVHSFVDWTWYVPGLACPALLCAGWLAGRGPLAEGLATAGAPAGSRAAEAPQPAMRDARGASSNGPGSSVTGARWSRPIDRQRLGAAAAVLIAALLAAWAEWQPQRSQDASNRALALIQRNPTGALAAAQAAVGRDPLSAEALITLAAVQQGVGQRAAAAATYAHAVHVQPSNWQTWEALGEYELHSGDARGALNALRAAVYLNPEAIAPAATINEELLTLQNDYLQALRATAATGGTAAASAARRTRSVRRRLGASGRTLRSARAAHLPATRAARRGGPRSRASGSPRSRSPRAA
jgi:cytochrome c-type biogenesis protein CcmH/NrfG